jgi:hypothetical protein
MSLNDAHLPDPRKPITLKLSKFSSLNFSGSSLLRRREIEAGSMNLASVGNRLSPRPFSMFAVINQILKSY